MADELALDEAALFETDALFEEELERRRTLDEATEDAADVVLDLQQRGPLYKYVRMRRDGARLALAGLVDADPKDATAIAALQVKVKEYVAACTWIVSVLGRGDEADHIIETEFGNKPPADE